MQSNRIEQVIQMVVFYAPSLLMPGGQQRPPLLRSHIDASCLRATDTQFQRPCFDC